MTGSRVFGRLGHRLAQQRDDGWQAKEDDGNRLRAHFASLDRSSPGIPLLPGGAHRNWWALSSIIFLLHYVLTPARDMLASWPQPYAFRASFTDQERRSSTPESIP
ncbi:hypothetical protein OUZ56_032695 [Daphnia magna]|uniref:Uncharacterized protein n=1 Tax=Daphnia magna TaxID=35525 RepID=A0ABQ9ZWU9_9CRUS|nr:hypothetical protein OUZ56_032695 [Daphnia magna]